MSIKCFFRHKYIPFKIRHYRDTSYSEKGAPSTGLVSKCCRKDCGKIKYNYFYGVGFLELEDFK